MLKIIHVLRFIIGFIAAWQILGLIPVLSWLANLKSVTGDMWAMAFIKFVVLIICGTVFFWLGRVTRSDDSSNESDVDVRRPIKRAVGAAPAHKKRTSVKQVEDAQLYEDIWKEIDEGRVDRALWARLFAACDGDTNKVKARYIQARVQELKCHKEDARTTDMVDEAESNVLIDLTVPLANPVQETIPSKEATIPNPLTDRELMEKFDVKFDGEFYHYKTYKYTKLEDAINYARLKRRRAK